MGLFIHAVGSFTFLVLVTSFGSVKVIVYFYKRIVYWLILSKILMILENVCPHYHVAWLHLKSPRQKNFFWLKTLSDLIAVLLQQCSYRNVDYKMKTDNKAIIKMKLFFQVWCLKYNLKIFIFSKILIFKIFSECGIHGW